MATYKVLAPYVTLKVADASGQLVVKGFYEGALVHDPVEGEVVDRHLRKGMVEKVHSNKKPQPEPQPEPEPASPEPDEDAEPAKPAGNASQEKWADYAVSRGASREEVADLTRDELRVLYGED